MTDAKGLSELKRWYVDEWGDCREANDGPFVKYTDYTERLKACEERADAAEAWVKHTRKERDQLTADLATTRRRYEQTICGLHQTEDDLQRARAEVERWKERANDNGTEATKLEQSNERLKATLVAIAHSHADKYGSTDGDGHARCIATAQAALTETSDEHKKNPN